MGFTYPGSFTPKLLRPDGMKALMAEKLLLKHQLFLITHSRTRAPISHPSIVS